MLKFNSQIDNFSYFCSFFAKTTEYHFEQVDQNATNLPKECKHPRITAEASKTCENITYELVSGPFRFKKAVRLDRKASPRPWVRKVYSTWMQYLFLDLNS